MALNPSNSSNMEQLALKGLNIDNKRSLISLIISSKDACIFLDLIVCLLVCLLARSSLLTKLWMDFREIFGMSKPGLKARQISHTYGWCGWSEYESSRTIHFLVCSGFVRYRKLCTSRWHILLGESHYDNSHHVTM